MFGLPWLDELVGQGNVLLRVDPGVDPSPFLAQYGQQHKATWLATDHKPAYKGPVADAHGAWLGHGGAGALDVTDDKRLMEFIGASESLMIDSLSTVMDRNETVGKNPAALAKALRGLAVYVDWDPHAGDRVAALFDNVVRLHAVEERVLTTTFVEVEKCAGKKVAMRGVPYRVDLGKIQAFVPKIIVTGPADSGKTTFVGAVADGAVSTDRQGTTVAMDRGTAERPGMAVEIWGTPGADRFDALTRRLVGQSAGIILMVDATKPETFARARDMLDMAWQDGRVALVVANKQDQQGALPPEDLAAALRGPGVVDIVPCVATDRKSADAVLDRLIDALLRNEVVV